MPKEINNATAVYVIMLVLFVAGIWAVLAFGSTLEAQPDLAGEWKLVATGAVSRESQKAYIEQSGQFIRMKFRDTNDPPLDLRIRNVDRRDASNGARPIVMGATSGGEVTFRPTAEQDVYDVSLPDGRTFVGTVVVRAHPRHRSPKSPAIPSVSRPRS